MNSIVFQHQWNCPSFNWNPTFFEFQTDEIQINHSSCNVLLSSDLNNAYLFIRSIRFFVDPEGVWDSLKRGNWDGKQRRSTRKVAAKSRRNINLFFDKRSMQLSAWLDLDQLVLFNHQPNTALVNRGVEYHFTNYTSTEDTWWWTCLAVVDGWMGGSIYRATYRTRWYTSFPSLCISERVSNERPIIYHGHRLTRTDKHCTLWGSGNAEYKYVH